MELKKNACKLTYLPARLSTKKDRWEIVYYQTNPSTGERKRHRETCDLNRIHDLKERKKAAKQAIEKINALLPFHYPYQPASEIERKLNGHTLAQAVRMAMDIKLKTDRYETIKDVNSMGKVFLEWMKKNKVDKMPVEDFTRRHALQYMDYVATRKTKDGTNISNRTWNNYRNKTGSLFFILQEREVVKENPFTGIKKKPVTEKKRRKFSDAERAAVATWLHENDFFTFLAITLQYYGLFRGTELRRMTAGAFDLQKGLIYLKGADSKTKRDRWVTMPDTLVTILKDSRFTSIPGNWLVFGLFGKPHPTEPCGRSHVWRHLLKCLQALQKAGTITDITGLSPYSMKDTGITEWLSCMTLPEVMRQAGHTNPATTMIYYQPDRINKGFQGLNKSIFDVNQPGGQLPISEAQAND